MASVYAITYVVVCTEAFALLMALQYSTTCSAVLEGLSPCMYVTCERTPVWVS